MGCVPVADHRLLGQFGNADRDARAVASSLGHDVRIDRRCYGNLGLEVFGCCLRRL